tara:strand:+ start:3124 stop:3996 length:873 start_codon:yes stop_codon:yes gene_type:complete
MLYYIMSDQKLCASCMNFSIDKILKSQPTQKPSWLSKTDYVEEFIHKQTKFDLKKPSKYDVVMNLELGKSNANKKILYWAATSSPLNKPIVNDAKNAYSKFSNNGITKTDSNGNTKIYFNCPQIYSTVAKGKKIPQTFFRHVHFVVSNKDETEWLSQIYTKVVVCKLSYKQIQPILKMKDKCHVFINALPCQYYAKDHIPDSYNLHNSDIKSMSVNELQKWFMDVIKVHYPMLHSLVKSGKLQIYELPIIVYCAHDKCNASELAIKELMKKGFVNIHEYSGGMKDYRKHN